MKKATELDALAVKAQAAAEALEGCNLGAVNDVTLAALTGWPITAVQNAQARGEFELFCGLIVVKSAAARFRQMAESLAAAAGVA